MNRKKSVLWVLVLYLLSTILLPSSMQKNYAAQLSNDQITILLDGEKLSFDVEPYIKGGRTLVPFRGILEALGAEVIWNPTERSVTAKSASTEVYLKIGSVDTLVNGDEVVIDVPAEITNDRTFVPLRFVSENLGATVGWDGTSRTVSIATKTLVVEPVDDPVASSGDVGVFDNGDMRIVIEKVEFVSEDMKFYIYGKADFNGNEVMLTVFDSKGDVRVAEFVSIGKESKMKTFKAALSTMSSNYYPESIIINVFDENNDVTRLSSIDL